jgi:uncharacterized protein (TIGR02996 family)
MPSENDLIQAVLADPDSDQPRLAYGQWLAERGDVRADFIRAQMELANAHRAHAGVATWARPYDVSKALLSEHGALWRLPLEPLVIEGLVTQPRFYRGFVEQVTMDAAAFAAHAPRVFAVAPIRHITLTGVARTPMALASPHLGRMVSLTLAANRMGDAGVQILANSPHVDRIAWLDLSHNDIGMPGLEALAGSPNLPSLVYVNFVGNQVPDPGESFGSEGEAILTTDETSAGRELERRFGPLRWLHAPSLFGDAWPPDPQAAVNP